MNSIIWYEEQRRKKKQSEHKCPLCGMTYSGHGNNPYPFQVENCCNNCNAKFVIPMRMFLNNKTPKYAVVFDTNGNIRPVKPKGDKFSLEELQSLVGGLIEVYPKRFNNRLVICNEEGLIKRLKKNEIFKKYSLKSLVGDIVLCPPNLFD